jgi:hypothetical protein
LLESIFEDLRRFCDETETTTTKKNQKSWENKSKKVKNKETEILKGKELKRE